MFITRKSILASCLILISFSTNAQTVIAKKEQARIKNDYADGFEVDLPGTYEDVDAALNKFMKTIGKTKQNENFFVVAEPMIAGRTYATPVYGTTKQIGNIISAWVGIKKSDWKDDEAEQVNTALQAMVREFGLNYHREKIQKQIDEALRAQQAVERQQQRLTNQNKDLTTRIEDNKREKIQLEKSIENNKLELENLTRRLEKNKKDQDSVAVAGEQIKKVVDMHRDRQRKVNR